MNKLLRARVPPSVTWALAGLLALGCAGACEMAFRPSNALRAVRYQAQAQSALPAGSSPGRVAAWLDSTGLSYAPVYSKGGEFIWFLVRERNPSWLQPDAGFWMQLNFDESGRLSRIAAGQD